MNVFGRAKNVISEMTAQTLVSSPVLIANAIYHDSISIYRARYTHREQLTSLLMSVFDFEKFVRDW